MVSTIMPLRNRLVGYSTPQRVSIKSTWQVILNGDCSNLSKADRRLASETGSPKTRSIASAQRSAL